MSAFRADSETFTDNGKVYIYALTGKKWELIDELIAPIPTNFSCFGVRLALSDATLLIGAWSESNGDIGLAGSVYVYSIEKKHTISFKN